MMDLVDYSMYDEATNGFFTIRVTQARAGELHNDHLKTARLINALKMQGQLPIPARERQGSYQQQGAIPKKKGKAFRWSQTAIEELLKSCYGVRFTLRKKKVPLSLFDNIALKMNALNATSEPVTAVQCREKVRWLKMMFDEAKKDNAEKDWEWGTFMRFIFDAPFEEVPPWLLASHPDTTTSGASSNSDCGVMEASFGRTYVLKEPRYVTSSASSNKSPVLTNDTLEFPNNGDLILAVVDLQKWPEESNSFAAAEDLNTSMLHSSTLPSETFFVRNLNLNSTPQKDNLIIIQSPPKKKTTNGEAGIRTPRSTPKRKKRYQTESWLPGITHALLKECLARKDQVQTCNPPTSMWKEVSNNLCKLGFTCEWQACREKFEYLNMFFEQSLLKVNGVMGQVKWPYYECWLQIHDSPINHIQPAGESTQDTYYENEEEDPTLWGDPKVVELLISLYKERRHLFKSSKSCIRHSTLYQEIAAIMKLFDYDRSSKQCQRKMNKLLDQFRKEFDRERRTGEAPSVWPWFKTIMEMEEGCPNLNAPFAFSVGALTQYSVQGVQKPVADKRNTTLINQVFNPSTLLSVQIPFKQIKVFNRVVVHLQVFNSEVVHL